MKLFLKYILCIISFNLYAGAPAPKDSLPQPPYLFKDGMLIELKLQWNAKSISKFIPKGMDPQNIIYGGINMYLTKSNKPLSNLNYTTAWMNIENNKRIIIDFYGPNDKSNRLINAITKFQSDISKSKMMLINNKISARTNIKNKSVLTITAIINNDCDKNSISKNDVIKAHNTNNDFIINTSYKELCSLSDIKLKFLNGYDYIIIDKIISGRILKESELKFSN